MGEFLLDFLVITLVSGASWKFGSRRRAHQEAARLVARGAELREDAAKEAQDGRTADILMARAFEAEMAALAIVGEGKGETR